MNWKNNLEELIKETLNVKRATKPDDTILLACGCTPRRFLMLLNNEVKMTALEALIFSDWLKTDVRDMVSTIDGNESENFKKLHHA